MRVDKKVKPIERICLLGEKANSIFDFVAVVFLPCSASQTEDVKGLNGVLMLVLGQDQVGLRVVTGAKEIGPYRYL